MTVVLHAGRDGDSCVITADVTNSTKYRLDAAEIQLGNGKFALDVLAANSPSSSIDVWRYNIPVETKTCEEQVASIEKDISTAKATTCTMPDQPEGDCQGMIRVKDDFDMDRIREADSALSTPLIAKNLGAGTTLMAQSDDILLSLFDDNSKPGGAENLVAGNTIQVIDYEKDKYGAAVWYKVKFDQGRGRSQPAATDANWILRAELDGLIADAKVVNAQAVEERDRQASIAKASANLKPGDTFQARGTANLEIRTEGSFSESGFQILDGGTLTVVAVETDKFGAATSYKVEIPIPVTPGGSVEGSVSRDSLDKLIAAGTLVPAQAPAPNTEPAPEAAPQP